MFNKQFNDAIMLVESMQQKIERIEIANSELVYFSNRSPLKDTPNEDALGIIPVDETTLVLVIADGMGGMPAGEKAAKTIVESLNDFIINKTDQQSLRDTILSGIEHADSVIKGLKNGSGSTVSVVEISENKMRTYHAGDSLVLLTNNDDAIKYVSVPHSPIGFALECGVID
ncbi:MAG: protein phosphatase 2C domain-containing protein, partial [Pseudomonadota bacterium]